MAKYTAIFYCGHESRYGQAHLAPLLSSEIIDIREVVFAPRGRWQTFRTVLAGEPHRSSLLNALKFQRNRWKSIRLVRRHKGNCRIRFVSDVNVPNEVSRAARHDLIISAAYPQIFSAELVKCPRHAAINFHPSYLPRCRGAHPVYWTIATHEAFGGVSCHIMTEKLDQGPIVAQRQIAFERDAITYSELYSRIEACTPDLVSDVEDFLASAKTALPQAGEKTYFRNDRAIHHKLSFELLRAPEISARIRAGQAFAFDRKGRKISFVSPTTITKSSPHMTNNIGAQITNGTVVDVGDGFLDIKVGDSIVRTGFRYYAAPDLRFIWLGVMQKLGFKNRRPIVIGEVLR